MNDDRANILRKVQGLLDMAASSGFTEEAEAFRTKADEMMTKYIIEENELRLAAPVNFREVPTSKMVDVLGPNSPIRSQVVNLSTSVASYCGVKILFYGASGPAKLSRLRIKAYGFATELDYFEVTLTSLLSQMANEMEPKPDPSLSDEENYEILRTAGVPGERLWTLMGWTSAYGQKIRKSWMEKNPDNSAVRPGTYIRSFAQGFASKVGSRLWEIRAERNRTTETSTALALIDRSKEVEEFYAEESKGLRPLRTPEQRLIGAGISRGRAAGARADIGQSRIGTTVKGQIRS